MAQTGYTPIELYCSTTPGNVPAASDLKNGELAINIADGKLFYKDSGGTVRLMSSAYPRVSSIVSASTITPASDTCNQYNVTGLLVAANVSVPSGTPVDGQKLNLRITSGSAGTLTLSWVTSSGGYRVVGTSLPTAIAAYRTIYVGCIWNSAISYWDVVSVATQL